MAKRGGKSGYRSDLYTGLTKMRMRAELLERATEESAQQLADYGKEAVRDRIMTSGTGREWKGWRKRSTGGSNATSSRYDTGQMFDRVESKVIYVSGKKLDIRVGWLRNVPRYSFFQDQGFTHWVTGEEIEGMFALRYGVEAMSEIAKQLFADTIVSTMSGKQNRASRKWVNE